MTEQGSLDRVPAAPDLPALAESGFAGLLAWAAQTRPEAPALEAEGDETVTRAELAARVAAVAGRLTDSGVTRGSVVGMALDNRVRSYVLVLAAATLGATILPLNPGFRAAELEALTELASPSHLVAVTEFTRSHAGLLARSGIRVVDIDGAAPGAAPAAAPAPLRDQPVWYGLTSGSTGLPKVIVKTQGKWLDAASVLRAVLALDPDDRLLSAQPCYYGDPLMLFLACLQSGACFVLLSRFRSQTFMRSVAERAITKFWTIGSMPAMLLNTPPGPSDTDHRAVAAWSIGIPRTLHHSLEKRFGIRWLEVYGSAEANVVFAQTLNSPSSPGDGWLGGIVPRQEVRMVDENGADLDGDGIGELLIRGRLVVDGYLRNPEATAAAVLGDGWYRSGDIMERRDGRIRFVRREKEIVRRAGENISTEEVERALRTHPLVRDAAVLPRADPIRGEEVWAVVELAHGTRTDARALAPELAEHAGRYLARHKVPRFVSVIDALPRTPSERVAKRLLRDRDDLDIVDLRPGDARIREDAR
ncbi:class I adenylate-forming enzyme family protein [Actinomadura madurae]|uniref:class I adenylate-forming enzyme family protein n=1 Tax=Actinomadura madurae TaxID=1993 RepID=UPI0020D227E6|nr:AMP-binding protein [Actinomadura madurae]MCP9950879.1 AMP-binding protein [Actinomadura madurae]MCP9967663.1 AMP-binding protein [Actinomadura madurae]MCP9980113.1 AMP-binding protein [Actinomadura madurae]MCQ0016326.1 AMP-binding protein [Actinomadura madurae]